MNPWRSRFLLFLTLFAGWLGGLTVSAATLPFSFSLDEDATTSAGIYKPDGTLVRTLWRKKEFYKGEHQATWDGLTDEQIAAPAANYAVRILSHQMDYIWQGAIGNTSTSQSGRTVHRGFRPLRDLTFSGENGFYITGYVEGDHDFRHFLTSDIQRVNDRWCWYLDRRIDKIVSFTGTIFTPEWVAIDTDGTWVYFASPDSTNPTTREEHVGPGFIVASEVATHKSASFTNGAPIETPEPLKPFANGIKIGSTKGLSGLAVEKNGTALAVSVRSEGKIYLVHKRTGAALRTINLSAPGQLAFAPNGDLIAISGNKICKITAPTSSPMVSTVVDNLEQPLDLAIDPTSGSIAVVDAGASQQVKAYTNTGNVAWTFGQLGGYSTNGPVVTRDKFFFRDREGNPAGSVAFGADGTLWINDPGNRRLLHYSADRIYIEEIMFQNVSYSTSVDANDPTRVFCDFLEFSVDYSKPLAQGWKLAKNRGANLPKAYFDFGCGVRQVTTLTNGRTYGVVGKAGQQNGEIVELTTQGTRLTNFLLTQTQGDPGTFETLVANGSLRRGNFFGGAGEIPAGARASFSEKPLLGFDAQNNPLWGDYTLLASAPVTDTDPATRCCSFGDPKIPITSSDVIVSFDPTKNNGWHLGGVRRGGNDWLWKASPTGPLDGLGTFDIANGVQYPGNSVFASGKNIIFGYHGEFWKDSQACAFMHFYDDGLFIGQFGESSLGHETFEGVVPGMAGNSAFSQLTEVNGKVYLWTNDESQHGPQRWLLEGTQTIREASATGMLGQTEPLIIPTAPASFPTDLSAKPGDARVSLTWNPVAGAKSYNVRMSTERGGISTVIAGQVAGTGKTINQLTNGQTYFFSVAAVTEAGESLYSNPVKVTPASLTSVVELAGRYDQPGLEPKIFEVNATNPPLGRPALRKLNPLLGNLALENVGAAGYRIFNWNVQSAINLPFGDAIESKSGWRNDGLLGYQFRIGNLLSPNQGLIVSETGSKKGLIEVTPHDTGVYYITVVMSPQYRNSANYKIRLSPKGQTTPSVGYDTQETIGINHFYQFRFRGPVVLSVECPTDTAAVQAIFLDPATLIPAETTGFQLWQRENFSVSDLENPSLSGPLADRDQDGQANFLEYALGTSPTDDRSRPTFLTKLLYWLGDDYLTLQFTRDRFAADANLQVGVTSDLTNATSWTWFDANDLTYRVSSFLDSPAKGLETIIVRDIFPAGNGPRFMQLSATQ